MKNKVKGLLALALAAFTSLTWAAELVIPYTFDGKTGNTGYAYEYQVKMPSEALTSFTTTIRYTGGSHRVEILGVKLLDGETEYTAVATGTEGTEVADEGSYSGGNNYHNIFTFTNQEGFSANKEYTLQAMLQVNDANPSHRGNIKVSGGITLYAMPYAFGVNFTKDDSNVTTDAILGYATEGYTAPAAWINVAGASGGYTSIAAPNAMSYTLTWSANGGHNSGNAKDSDAKKLLYGYLDDVASGPRKKASVTITGLPADRKYAVAVILSGDGADGKNAFNNVYSPVLINGQTYSYDADGNLLTGEAAMAVTTWGDRRASASTDGTLTVGKNVMFVEDLSGSELTITSALDAAQISRLTIAGIQVWISEETVTPTASASALPEGAEVISVNFNGGDLREVSGVAGLYASSGWNNFTKTWGTGAAAEEKKINATSLKIAVGDTQVEQSVTLAVTAYNTYDWDTATDAFLKGYLDDGGNRAQVTLNNIPFEKYSVIVYTATDSGTNYRFATVQINNKVYIGTPYATSIGYAAEVEGMGAIWGQACQKTAAYGVNALRVDGLSGNLSIQGGSNANNARGGIAAIQIVNTGDSILSDVQEINWINQPADQIKVSELPELTKAIVKLKLADDAILEVDDAIPAGHSVEIEGDNVTVNITKLELGKAEVEAIVFGAASVTTSYTETLGYTKGDVTYPLIFRGTTDANWATLSNWYIGTRTNGTKTYWIPYDKTVVPGATGSDEWRTTLVDGELMAIAAGEDDYETVNAPKLEGWASKITVANGAHLKLQDLVKLQGACEWHIEDSSKITLAAFSNGNNDDSSRKFYVNALEGLTVGGTFSAKVAYYFDEDGSAAYATLNNPQTIAGLVLDLGTTAEGRKVVSRKLIGFTGGGATFTVPNGAVTTTAEDVTLETAEILQNVGQYRFEKKDDGYYVSYVAYAETDEIGAMNTWTATVDGNWNTAGNWSSGFVPAANADATIEISENTTITIPAEGITVGVLTVNGEGKLTIAGGKLTATKIFANVSITANENTLALAPMNIEAGKTVAYTIDTNGDQKVPALTGAGTFAKAGTGMLTMDKDSACDASITVNAGTLRFHEYAYDKTYNIVAKDGAKIQVGTWAGSLTSTSNTLKLEGGAMLQLNNGNATTGAIVKGTIVIDSTAEKPAVIKGNKNGNNGVIAATIKGNGVLEIQDDNDNYFTISGVISDGDAEGDVLAVKVVTDRGVTFTGANTYTGGTVVAEGGILKVQKMSALGAANTEVNIAKGGKVTVTSTGNVTEDAGVARAVFAGEGTVEFNGAGYYVLPNNFKAPAYLINNQADNLTIATDGTYDVGSYSGEKYFRMDYNQKGDRAFVITQRADATIASDIVQMFGSITDAERLTDVTVKGVDGATLTLSGAHNNIHFRTLTIDTTGSVNLAGGWKGDVDAYGIIAGTGTIGGRLKLQKGATLDVSVGALNVTGEVWVMNGASNTASVTLPENYAVDTPIISCSNAEAVAADLSAKMPTGYKCVADGNTVKLAVAEVTVTLPSVSNAVWKDANGNTITSITLAPNSSASVKLETMGDYVFADGSTSKDVTIASGDADSEATAPADASIVAAGAKIGDKLYTSLAAAVDAAEANATITLLAGVTINSRLDIAQNVTIDLNGQTIAETMEDQFGAIYVKKGATLTIAATNGGEITTDGGIVIGNYGNVVVNGGTIAAGDDAEADVSIYNFYYQADWYGTTTINGGTVARIWNCGVATLAGGVVTDVDNSGAMEITEDATVANIILRDGTDAPGIEGAGTLTAPEGLTVTTMDGQTVVYADGKYTVVAIPVSNDVARIGETGYETLQKACEAAKEGDIVVLIADTEENCVVKEGFNGTIDLGGNTLTGRIFSKSATMTIQNGTIVRKWIGDDKSSSNGAIEIQGGSLVLEDTLTVNIFANNVTHLVRLKNSASCVINGGNYSITATGTDATILYPSAEGTSMVVNGGTFTYDTSNTSMPSIANIFGTLTVNGGTFNALNQCNMFNIDNTGGKTYVKNGFFNCSSSGRLTYNNPKPGDPYGYLEFSGGKYACNPETTRAVIAEGYASGLVADGNYIVAKAYSVALTCDTEEAVVSGLNDAHACGTIVSFTVAANEGFKVTGVTLDGSALTADVNGKYTFTMPEKDVAIVVTTEAASTFDVMINGQPVADADALKGAANSTTTMTVPETSTWTAEGNVLKKDGAAYVEFADYYTVVVNGTSVTLKLNKPVIGDSAEGADDAFTVTANAVTIKISNFNSALKYGVRSAANINSLKTAAITEVETEDGVITLTKSGDSAFYEVVVSDVDFPATTAE